MLSTSERRRRRYNKRNYSHKRNVAFVRRWKLAAGCFDCGISGPVGLLEFDHLRDKIDAVSAMLGRPTWVLIAEIEKCVVRCASCHRLKTLREGKGGRPRRYPVLPPVTPEDLAACARSRPPWSEEMKLLPPPRKIALELFAIAIEAVRKWWLQLNVSEFEPQDRTCCPVCDKPRDR